MTIINAECLGYLRTLPDNSVDLIVTDPPYQITNTKTGGGSRLSQTMQGAFDELEDANMVGGFSEDVLHELLRVNKNINQYYFCNKVQLPMYIDFFVNQRKCSFELIKWVKTNAMPTFYNKFLTDTEYCIYVRKRGYCKPENYEDASTLYHAPINAADKKLYKHPTIKPLPLVMRLIRNSSKEGDVVLDPFMGSGTTGVACKLLGRKFIGVELNEGYYNIAKQRIAEGV